MRLFDQADDHEDQGQLVKTRACALEDCREGLKIMGKLMLQLKLLLDTTEGQYQDSMFGISFEDKDILLASSNTAEFCSEELQWDALEIHRVRVGSCEYAMQSPQKLQSCCKIVLKC